MADADTKQVAGKRRGWSDDPLSVFLLVGAVVLALMYGVETRQRSGLSEREAQAVAIAERAGFSAPACTIGAAGASGEILVVSCKRESIERVLAGVSAGLRDAASAGGGFERVYLVGQDRGGQSEHRLCALSGDLKIDLETCRELGGRPKDGAQVVVGVVGVK